MGATRVAVFGDIGGHAAPFDAALTELGCDTAAGTIPDGLTVIQVGDLIHKGPDSAAAVALADRFRAAGARWVQLAGNHEHQYLGGDGFWADIVDEHTQATLHHWWATGWLELATHANGTLITHAGLTRGLWRQLGEPATARAAALAINAAPARAVTRSGWMLAGNGIDHCAGVNWAEATREVIGSWEGHRMPFDQVAGHSTPYRWANGRLADRTLGDRVDGLTIDTTNRHVHVELGGHHLHFIDPRFGAGGGPVHPFILEG